MKNPLIKRIPREFCQDLGKYMVIFLFMIILIGAVSGFLVTDNSFEYLYNRGFTELRLEDGHFSFCREAPEEVLDAIEEKGDISIHDLYYFEEKLDHTEKTIRVYMMERDVDLPSLLRGEFPKNADEIALDRMFADNNQIDVGDEILLKDRKLTVSGLIASPDYSCLFEKNSDMMFDSINFSIAAMTKEGFEQIHSSHLTYNYAWLYPEFVPRTDKETAKKKSDKLIDVLEEVLTDYNTELFENAMTGQQNPDAEKTGALSFESGEQPELLQISDYLPRYLNQAINFTGDDMGGDRGSFLVFDYLITLVLGFVFAITTNNTIVKEAGVIGTLRASGYTRRELILHYMILPVVVSLTAAVIGNILGYTVFTGFFLDVYYGSYSFPKYEALWNADAFLLTTVVPLLLMFAVNLFMLIRMLKLSPLKFLRRDLSRRGKKKSFYLNKKIPFIHRFRMRILFQNIPNYLTLFCGIFIGGVLMVFGTMFEPMLADYKDLILEDRICDYQYVLMEEVETKNPQAEKFSLTSLATTNEKYVEDEVSVFGIEENSRYVPAEIEEGKIAVSSAFSEKFSLKEGDPFVLKDPYNSKKTYDFTVGSVYDYTAGMAVFMTRADYGKKFEVDKDAFSGYFSNEKLTDIGEEKIAALITTADLTKVSDQLTVSMGDMMILIKVFGIIVFCLLVFIMSKQIIEKNAASISMTKILGFYNGEIGRLYIAATSIVVVLSLLVTVPLVDIALRLIFTSYLYTMMAGYVPYIVSKSCYVQMILTGIVCYVLIAILQIVKISRIPKSDALKNLME